jgi:S-DNA-T family DNA segregation ATPase FtsK/SpoIIIE
VNGVSEKSMLMYEALSTLALPVCFGQDENGESIVRDLGQLPHLIIGGLSGFGKTVFLHSLICSLVRNRSPEQVQFVIMDSGEVEFCSYAKLPHLFSPIVHDVDEAVETLKYLELEMERRHSLIKEKGFDDVIEFNKHSEERKRFPFVVVAVDELSEFMICLRIRFESIVNRLAKIGKNVGIHFVLATSRPCSNVITEGLMTNISCSLAFRVVRKIDSYIFLNEAGAEGLSCRGDALLKIDDGSLIGLHTPLIEEEKIRHVVKVATMQYPGRKTSMEFKKRNKKVSIKNEEILYDRAVDLIRKTNRVSITYLQRNLDIGYNTIARILSLLEERGVIGPVNSDKPREILINRYVQN